LPAHEDLVLSFSVHKQKFDYAFKLSIMTQSVAVFIGTRPEAIKLAPVVKALVGAPGVEPIVVSTGQHKEMLTQVVELFDIPIHHELDVMTPNQSLSGLTARLLEKMDALLGEVKPDFSLVQGDTTTAMTGALASFYRGVPIGHVEAGLRTGDLKAPFPEEANRKIISAICDLHFAPTQRSGENLEREGVDQGRIHITGNTVVDALLLEVHSQEKEEVKQQVDEALSGELGVDWRSMPYVLITGHRRENFGDGFEAICDSIKVLADRYRDHRFVYPVHLNPKVKEPVSRRLAGLPNVFLLEPQSYRPFVALMQHALLLLTDSGGIQGEAPVLGKPTLVMRRSTERPEGVDSGSVKLVGSDSHLIVESVSQLIEDKEEFDRMAQASNPYGDGHASEKIVSAILNWVP